MPIYWDPESSKAPRCTRHHQHDRGCLALLGSIGCLCTKLTGAAVRGSLYGMHARTLPCLHVTDIVTRLLTLFSTQADTSPSYADSSGLQRSASRGLQQARDLLHIDIAHPWTAPRTARAGTYDEYLPGFIANWKQRCAPAHLYGQEPLWCLPDEGSHSYRICSVYLRGGAMLAPLEA